MHHPERLLGPIRLARFYEVETVGVQPIIPALHLPQVVGADIMGAVARMRRAETLELLVAEEAALSTIWLAVLA